MNFISNILKKSKYIKKINLKQKINKTNLIFFQKYFFTLTLSNFVRIIDSEKIGGEI
jgi:hypothetical protein